MEENFLPITKKRKVKLGKNLLFYYPINIIQEKKSNHSKIKNIMQNSIENILVLI